MEKERIITSKRFSGRRLSGTVVLCSALLLLLSACDKLFIPGDVPDGPPVLTLTAEAGERTEEPLSYYWEKTKTEVRTEKEGPDPLDAEYDPLVVQPGEPVRFTFTEGNSPYIMNVTFFESDGNGGFLGEVMLSPLETDSGSGEAYLYAAPAEDGILVAEAVWPVWVNSGIRAEVTYAFYVWSAKG